MKKGFIEESLVSFHGQQLNFNSKIGSYAVVLSLDAADLVSIAEDAGYLGWALTEKHAFATNSHSWTDFGDLLLYKGIDVGIVVAPAAPAVVVVPAGVNPGMRGRFSKIAAACKLSPNYTETIGKALGIVATDTPFVPQDGTPEIKIKLQTGHPFLGYLKDSYQGAQIYKDSADGNGMLKFDKAINATYTDNLALPAAGETLIWKYKMVYLYGGVEVGTASNVVSITVTGV